MKYFEFRIWTSLIGKFALVVVGDLGPILLNYFCRNWTAVKLRQDFDASFYTLNGFASVNLHHQDESVPILSSKTVQFWQKYFNSIDPSCHQNSIFADKTVDVDNITLPTTWRSWTSHEKAYSSCILLPPRLTSTFLTLLLFPLQDDVLIVLASPGDGRLRRALGLADQCRVVILTDAHGGGRAVQIHDVWRN